MQLPKASFLKFCFPFINFAILTFIFQLYLLGRVVMCFDYWCRLYTAFLINCYLFFIVFFFLYLQLVHLSEGLSETASLTPRGSGNFCVHSTLLKLYLVGFQWVCYCCCTGGRKEKWRNIAPNHPRHLLRCPL